jgi:hypothetical protein
MPLLKSAQSGNWDSASTWNVCTAVNEPAPTASPIPVAPAAPGGIANGTYNSTFNALGFAIKLASRGASITGTVTGSLSGIAGTSVTLNIADIASPSLGTTAANSVGHWVFFKFAAPVAIANGTVLTLLLQVSAGASLSVFRGSSNVWHMFVVTEETKAPAATDTFCIIGDNSASGKGPAIEVIMNNTTSTLYGPATAVTALNTYALYVGDNATLTYGTAESTNYNLRISGHVGIGSGGADYPGTFNIGKTTTPIPRTSTATLEIVGAAIGTGAGSYFTICGGRLFTQGSSRTVGKNVDRCLLTANANVGASSVTVDTDTGWLNTDTVVFPVTARVSGGATEHSLTANATSNTLSITPNLAAARDGGASGVQGEVILITRNVLIRSATPGTINIWMEISGSTTVVDCDWTRFTGIGSSASNRFGIYLGSATGVINNTTPANITFNNCIFYNNTVNFQTISGVSAGAKITDCTFVQIGVNGGGIGTFTSVSSDHAITNAWVASNATTTGISIRDHISITNLRVCSCNGGGMVLSPTPSPTSPSGLPSINGVYIKSTIAGIGISSTTVTAYDLAAPLVINNLEMTRINGSGFLVGGVTGVIVDNFRLWGSATANILNQAPGGGDVIFRNGFIASQTTNTTPSGISSSALGGKITLENCRFGTGFALAQPHTTQDVQPSSAASIGVNVFLRNCEFTGPVEVATPTVDSSSVISENHDQIVGSKKIWVKRGVIATDTSGTPNLVHSGVRSIRLQPNSTAFKLEYVFAKVAVAAGTTPTVGIYVRKSLAGDGTAYSSSPSDQPRLIVKRNVLVGINSDTVLATASAANGTWELLTGTLPTLTANGVVELEVDCSGSTGGWVNIDSFQAPAAVNTKSFEISDDTLAAPSHGDNSTGGGGSPVTVGYAFVG